MGCTPTWPRPPAARNLRASSSGGATALVATDIAARGIHVDDVTLVVLAGQAAAGRGAAAGRCGHVRLHSGTASSTPNPFAAQ